MDRTRHEASHVAVVDDWIKRSVGHGSAPELIRMFGAAFEAVWTSAVSTLGTVTLTAISERVLGIAAGRYPFLAVVNPRPNGDTRWRQLLHERLASVPRADLLEGLRFGMIELVAVIGRLTAEILSADLHAAILGVFPGIASPPVGKRGGDTSAAPAAADKVVS